MTQLPMYPAQVNSPGFVLAADISASDTEILFEDLTRLLPAPNTLDIYTDDNDTAPETVRYTTDPTGNTLTVERGFEGTAKPFLAGAKAYREFTAYDHNTDIANIADAAAHATGTAWYQGTGIPDSGTGNDGDFYLRTSTDDLYLKSAGAWSVLVNIKGATGSTGPTGPTGATGPQGDTGATGAKGDKGDTGAAGAQGATGATGAAGADGSILYSGSSTPSSGTGVNGDYYLDTTTYDLYKKISGSWTVQCNIKGATGEKGTTGDTGAQGAQGATGATGAKGDKGDTGSAGPGVVSGGSTGQILAKKTAADYDTQWVTPGSGSGDVVGPSSATDGAIALFDTTTGKKIKDSAKTLATTLGSTDATVPTSKAVKDVTDGKAATSHSHAESDVTNLVTDLAGKAAASHTHAEGDVTNLTTDLAAKATDTAVLHKATAGEIAALTEKTTPASADLLIIEDSAASNAKKKIQIGNLPSSGGGGASLWTALTATTDFATTAPATNQITMNADKTATILVGYTLKIVFNSNTYYVRVSTITSSLITFEGPPITTGAGLLTAVSWGDESRITDSSLVVQMPGYVDPQAEGNYVNNRIGIPNGIPWIGPKAYLTGFKFRVAAADSGGSQPIVNVLVGTWVAGTTSTTSIAIGTGSKTFTTASSDQYAAGQLVVIRSTATPANAMLATVTSCSGTSLVVNVVAVTGTGTIASWTISAGGMYPVSTSNSSGGVTLSSSVANTGVDITVVSNTNISISPGQTLEISVFPGATTPRGDAYGGVMSVYAVTT